AERLRHVVVRAGVERGDLLGLVADDGEDDDRRRAPRAQLARDVGAARVRQHEVEDHRVGRTHRRQRQRLLPRRRRVDLVAGAAQARLERAEDLRLVVDDEDTRHARSASTKCPPSPFSDQTRAPFTSAKPRAIASPRPAPRVSPSPRRKGSKTASRSTAATPGPASSTWSRSSPPRGPTRTRTGASDGENFNALSSRLTRAR